MSEFELAKTYFFKGIECLSAFDYAGATVAFREADRLAPNRVSVLTNLTAALIKQDCFEEAETFARRSVELDENNAEGWLNWSNCLAYNMHLSCALEYCDKSIQIQPDSAQAWLSRGVILHQMRRDNEANTSFDHAYSLSPNLAGIWIGKANILRQQHNYSAALEYYQKALASDPNSLDAKLGVAHVFLEQRRYEEAAFGYQDILAASPRKRGAHGGLLQADMHLCDWRRFESLWMHVLDDIAQDRTSLAPLYLYAMPFAFAEQYFGGNSQQTGLAPRLIYRKYAEAYRARNYSATPSNVIPAASQRHAERKKKIAYLSSDFGIHPVSQLCVEIWEKHDRKKFTILGIALRTHPQSEAQLRVKNAFDEFFEVEAMTDDDLVAFLRRQNIDIAVNLNGHTDGERTEIFAQRVAPVQVSYLGFPGTMGSDFMDYIVADRTVIPEDDQALYSEKVAYLPDCFLPRDTRIDLPTEIPSRASQGLPDAGLVFCAFNNSHKLTPDVFRIWMTLLDQAPGSVLWLSAMSEAAMRNLRATAVAHQVSPERLVFARRTESLEDHFARFRLADLFLDTFYYNAHTTASDALWAGVPVLTCPGHSFASRVAASLVAAAGLPELIAQTPADYQRIALTLAQAPESLARMRHKLDVAKNVCPLFDSMRYVLALESLYDSMVH